MRQMIQGEALASGITVVAALLLLTAALLFQSPIASGQATPTSLATDKAALQALYDATDGANWDNNTGWDFSTDPSDAWHGVTLENGRVGYLLLNNNNLTGTIPTELGSMSKLKALYLGDNDLAGTIPTELGNMSDLLALFLYENSLTGTIPTELGDLSKLTGLRLDGNDLSGQIPTELGNLSKLSYLDLGDNDLSGSIPSELGDLSDLILMYLDGNDLNGSIPSDLGDLSSLQTLNLGGNDLSGSIPSDLGDLSSLKSLNLVGNSLTGGIPTTFINLTKVDEIRLTDNSLCLPAGLSAWYAGITTREPDTMPVCPPPTPTPAPTPTPTPTGVDYDADDNGLIDVANLAQLDAIRWDLDGDGVASNSVFSTAFPDPRAGMGCPSSGCSGYELAADLDFDTTGDGKANQPQPKPRTSGCRVDANGNWPNDHKDCVYDDYWNDGAGWAPIANYATTFDGNGHTILNLFIDRPSADDMGLFGSLTGSATARGVGLDGVDVTGKDAVGGLVGKSNGVIKESHVSGEVAGDNDVGGLMGWNLSGATVRNSYSLASVTGTADQVGGLAGRNRGTIEYSVAAGEVEGVNEVGGVAGRNSSGATVRQSYSLASVTGTADRVGGLAGRNQGTIERGYTTGRVSGDELVGGLVGENASTGTIRQGYASGRVSGVQDTGGLAGKNDSGTCENSYWDTESTGYTTSGCGTGKTTDELLTAKTATNLYALWDSAHWATGDWQYPTLKADWDGDGTATWREFGEQLPFFQDRDRDGFVDISNVYQLSAMRWDIDGEGDERTRNEYAYRAGFRYTSSALTCPRRGCVGYELVTDLDFDTNGDGAVDSGDALWNEGAGWEPIDGFRTTLDGRGHTIANLFIDRDAEQRVALFASTTLLGLVKDLGLDDVDITGSSVVAGVVGYNEGTIERTYVTGRVKASSYAGALAGDNRPSATIKVSYATATINARWYVGGLAGRNIGIIEDSYAAGPVSGYSDIGGVVGHNYDILNVSVCENVARRTYAIGLVTGSTPFYGGIAMVSATDQCPDTYWDTEATGTDWSACGTGYTTAELQAPTSDTGIYANWPAAIWDFRTATQYPALKADWDGDGTATWQEFGDQHGGDDDDVDNDARNDAASQALPNSIRQDHASDGAGTTSRLGFGVQEQTPVDYDSDDDGLIEISKLAQLNAIRWDPDGDGVSANSGYAAAFPDPEAGMGCPSIGCSGYELTADLDFDTTGDGKTNQPQPKADTRGCVADANGNWPNGHSDCIYDDYWNAGSGWAPIASYAATFDGNGRTIRNLFIDRASTDDVGLFASLTSASAVRDAHLADVDVAGNDAVGGLAGRILSGATVRQSYAAGSVAGSDLVGGLAGENSGVIERSYADGEVEGDNDVGGLLGRNSNGATAQQSYSLASVTGTADRVGGLAGRNQGTIERGYATGAVSGDELVGGLVGENASTGTMRQGYASGPVTGVLDTGGLVGKNDSGTCQDSYWDTDTSGSSASACGTGQTTDDLMTAKTATNLYALWSEAHWATGDWQYPTLKADWDDDGTATWREFGEQLPFFQDRDRDGWVDISNVYQLNAMRWDLFGEGEWPTHQEDAYRAGFRYSTSVSTCPRRGCSGYQLVTDLDFDTDGSGAVDSGDALWNEGAGWDPIDGFSTTFDGDGHTIANLFIDRQAEARVALLGSLTRAGEVRDLGLDDVNISGYSEVAGVVGYNEGTIQRSYVTGLITARIYCGALAGDNRPSAVIKVSYANARINGRGQAGGLAGRNIGIIEDSYANGPVSGYSDLGGLVGHNHDIYKVSVCENAARRTYATGLITGSTPFYGGITMAASPPTSTCPDSYWDTDATGTDWSACGAGYTTAELQAPTSDTGIYANWPAKIWDFGTAAHYPLLKADWDGDGTATWKEFGDQRADYDRDDDGLIEISSLARLNAVRWDIDGDGIVSPRDQANYDAAFPDAISGMGCPSSGCSGYELAADLDFDTDGDGAADSDDAYWNGGEGWDPIPRLFANLEGNGHTLSNLFINRPNRHWAALLANVRYGYSVKNVNLSNVDITGSSQSGSLVGYNAGSIEGSKASGKVVGVSSKAGGLVGTNTGSISRSSAAVTVTVDHNGGGGLVGENQNGAVIVASYATGDVNAPTSGGLAGYNFSTITSSYATGDVTGRSRTGGLVGFNFGPINKSYATGTVVSAIPQNAGGLAGHSRHACADSYWDTTTSGMTVSGCGEGKTTAELQTPTSATGIYANWGDVWDFGGTTDYPTLPD